MAVGKGAVQDRIILQNAFVACCLEAGAANTIAPIVTPAFARDIEALDFASMSIESYSSGASIFSVAGGGTGKLAEQQLNAARAWDLGAIASTTSVADLQAAANQELPQDCPTNVTAVIHFGSEGPQHWNVHATRGSPILGSRIPSICHKGVAYEVCSSQRTDARALSPNISHAKDSGSRYSLGAEAANLRCHDSITGIQEAFGRHGSRQVLSNQASYQARRSHIWAQQKQTLHL